MVLHIGEQSRFWGTVYVFYVDEKEDESPSCLLFDSDDSDGDDYRTSASARSFKRRTSSRSSNRKNTRRGSCSRNHLLYDQIVLENHDYTAKKAERIQISKH